MKIVLISLAMVSALFSMNRAFADEVPATVAPDRNPAGVENQKAVGHDDTTNPGQGVGHTDHGNGYGFGHNSPAPTPTPTPTPLPNS